MSSSFLILLMISSDSPSLPIFPLPFTLVHNYFSFYISFTFLSILFLNSFFFSILASRFLVNLNCFLIYWIISQEEGSVFKQLALFYHFLYIYIVNTIYTTYYFNFQVISLFYVSILQNVM